jgi:hypothetical protein
MPLWLPSTYGMSRPGPRNFGGPASGRNVKTEDFRRRVAAHFLTGEFAAFVQSAVLMAQFMAFGQGNLDE